MLPSSSRLLWSCRISWTLVLARNAVPVSVNQIRGAKQKFGAATRDPYKALQKKLVRAQQQKHAKVPLMSEERAQIRRLAPVTTSSLGQIVATYAPLEKFAKAPVYTRAGLSQRRRAFSESLGTIYSMATIRRRLRKVDPFRPIDFAKHAQQQFADANATLQNREKYRLRELVTEDAVESLKEEFEHRRFVWKFVEQIERPRVVNAKIVPLDSRENYFAQVVVRMHSSQIMAVYSSAGDLLRGHPSRPKPVIDYIVMERRLENVERGLGWRIAGKLPPQLPWRTEREEKNPPSQQQQLDKLASCVFTSCMYVCLLES